MRKTWEIHRFGVLLIGLLAARLAWGETLEMVTYYPAPAPAGGGVFDRLHADRATVGDAYNPTNVPDVNVPDGQLFVFDRVGIGTITPAGPLHVVGVNDAVSSLLFMPGANTPAAGTPDLQIGIGTATPTFPVHVVSAQTVDQPMMMLEKQGLWAQYGATSFSGVIPEHSGQFIARRARGTRAAPAAVQNGDTLGALGFRGHNGAAWIQNGVIRAVVDGAVGANNLPTALVFSTTNLAPPFGPVERMRVTGIGRVGIGTNNPQMRLDVNGDILGSGGIAFAGGGGDVNGDGVVAAADATAITNYLNGASSSGLTEPQRVRADVTGDGSVTSVDSATITAALAAGGGGGATLTTAERRVGRFAFDRTLSTDLNRNLSIAVAPPPELINPPNGTPNGNLSVNDVWLRSAGDGAGEWLSTLTLPSATGTYIGNGGGGPRLINVGFRPSRVELLRYDGPAAEGTRISFFIKHRLMPLNVSTYENNQIIGAALATLRGTRLNIVGNGFTVGGNGNTETNQNTIRYDYIAYH